MGPPRQIRKRKSPFENAVMFDGFIVNEKGEEFMRLKLGTLKEIYRIVEERNKNKPWRKREKE